MDNLPVKIDLEGIGKITEPITKLIEVISLGIGKLYEPTHRKKLAKSEAYQKVTEAIANEIVDDIKQRGLQVFLNQIGHKQLNIETIINKSIKYLPIGNTTSKKLPEKDWVLDFFDLCQNCSNDEVQEIWAKLLADKVDNPDAHSRRLMHTIKTLEVREAIAFSNLSKCYCEVTLQPDITHDVENLIDEPLDNLGYNFGTIWHAGETIILDDEGKNFNITFDTCLTLEEIGLLTNKEYVGEDRFLSELTFINFENGEKEVYKLKNATISIFEFTKLGFELFEVAKNDLDLKYKTKIISSLKKADMIR